MFIKSLYNLYNNYVYNDVACNKISQSESVCASQLKSQS